MNDASTASDTSPAETRLLVGRSPEQRLLREELAAAASGHGRLVVIGGEAGIGKTTLARDLAKSAADDAMLVLVGHCYDLTATPPYGPWLDLAADARRRGDLPPLPAALASGRIDEIESQAALFAQARDWFAALAERQPTLVILEDLHWADHASIELLRHLGAGVASLPLCLLATYRLDELTRRHPFYQQLPALVRDTDCRRIDLRPLAQDDLRALVAARWILAPPDRERLVAYLERHAEGNPFFATELLRALEEESLLRRDGNGWALGDLDRVVMPSLVRQVIDGRVARLGEGTRVPLALAAVIGQEVPLALWAEAAGLSEDEVFAIVEQAAEAHLLDPEPDGVCVRFGHALIREALYDGVVAPRRRRWHRQVAEILATHAGASPDVVADHFQRASDARAWEWHVRAGERAQRAYAWLTATERFSSAAALLEGVPGLESQRARLLYRCGRLRRYADTREGIANLAVAERVANLAGDRMLAADATYSRGLLHCFADEFGIGVVEIEAGIAALEALPPEEARPSWSKATWLADALPSRELAGMPDLDPAAELLIAAGVHHRRGGLPWFLSASGHLTRAQSIGEQFVAVVEGRPAGELTISATGHAWFGLGLAHAALGRPDESRPAFARGRAIYRIIDHHAVIGFTLLSELRDVVLPYDTTNIAERRRLAREAETALVLAAGAVPSDRSSRRARLGLLFLEGAWDEACAIVDEAPEHGNYVLRREATNTLAPIWLHRGRVDLLQTHIAALLPQGPAAEPGSIVLLDGLLLQRLAADLALDRGDFATALAWLEANDRWLAWSGAVLGRAENHLAWARYCRAIGDFDRAIRRADAAIADASRPTQPLALLAAYRLRGELALAAGDLAGAERRLKEALDLAAACAAPFEQAVTSLVMAETLAAMQRRDEARIRLNAARAILDPLGAKAAIRRADDLALRLDVPPIPEDPAGLTPREIEVLRLVAQGLTDAEVGGRLFISPRTVSQHLRSIYNKVGVSSRAAATRFAMERNLA